MDLATKVSTIPRQSAPHEASYHVKGDECRTFQHESNLPSLPLGPLQDTLDLYLDSLRPHLTSEEYILAKDEVDSFAEGRGPSLQNRLLQRQSQHRNWLEDWWLHYAYLTHREPLIPTLNTAGPHPLNLSLWKPNLEKAFEYGSLYLWAFLQFNLVLREEQLRPHITKEGRPLSMEQFRWVFNCTRIPGQDADSLRSCFKTKEEGDCPVHLVVLCKGHLWICYPWDSEGKPLSPPELETQLREVWESSSVLGPGPGIAVLTCDKRQTWAKNRDWLKSLSISNMRNLDMIETAAFAFVLDDSTPGSYDELLWEGLCGDTTNRWADKSLSAILTRNGYGVMNNDHTPYDAMVSVMIGHYQHLLLTHMNGQWDGPTTIRMGLSPPQRLIFDIDTKINDAIIKAKETTAKYTSDVKVKSFFFTEYGRDFLRPYRLHPDSYVQMALQLSYLRLHGRPAPTYETATTRQFFHGRTETIRSCTSEAMNWAQIMLDSNALISEKKRKLLSAIEKHNVLRQRSEKNRGVDRHLFGLYVVALEAGEDIPSIFTNPAFFKSGGGGNYVLSTSTLGNTPVYGGVAAMTTHGYGCFYNMMPDRFNFFVSHFVSSGETDCITFVTALTASLRDMKEVLDSPTASL